MITLKPEEVSIKLEDNWVDIDFDDCEAALEQLLVNGYYDIDILLKVKKEEIIEKICEKYSERTLRELDESEMLSYLKHVGAIE